MQRKLAQFKQSCKARSQLEIIRQQADLASLSGDQAEYELASRAYTSGDLPSAAEWYRKAAINDFADAPLKLAMVLDSLAEKHRTASEGQLAGPEELYLATEAAHWYLTAYAAGDIEALEVFDCLERLLKRHNPADRPARPRLVVAADDVHSGEGTRAPAVHEQPAAKSPATTSSGDNCLLLPPPPDHGCVPHSSRRNRVETVRTVTRQHDRFSAQAKPRDGRKMCVLPDFKIRSLGNFSVVSTPPDLDVSNARELMHALLTASTQAPLVVVDMTTTTFCDSTGLLPLHWMSEWMQAACGELRVVCNERVRRIMAITKDDAHVAIFASVTEALDTRPRLDTGPQCAGILWLAA